MVEASVLIKRGLRFITANTKSCRHRNLNDYNADKNLKTFKVHFNINLLFRHRHSKRQTN